MIAEFHWVRNWMSWRTAMIFNIIVLCFLQTSSAAEVNELLFELKWENFLDVAVVEGNDIWAVGLAGLIVHSSDGGGHWQKQESNVRYEWLNGVFFSNATTGWIAGAEGSILNTTNAGQTWTVQRIADAYLMDIQFVSSQTGLACGLNGAVFHSADAGKNWIRIQTPTTEILNRLTWVPPNNVWAVGARGTILHSPDAGQTWQLVNAQNEEMLYDIAFNDALTGWICGRNGTVLSTDDGGTTWKKRNPPTKQELCSISIINQTTVFAVGGSLVSPSFLFFTKDSGTNWQKIQDVREIWWKKVICSSSGDCLLAGHDSIIRYSLPK